MFGFEYVGYYQNERDFFFLPTCLIFISGGKYFNICFLWKVNSKDFLSRSKIETIK
jgi:hypothetical protein